MSRTKTQPSNRRHGTALLRAVVHWPSVAAHRWAEQFVGHACQDYSIDAVVVIGSAARGLRHSRSDVDFVVIYHDPEPNLDEPPIDVDVRKFPRTSVEERLAEGHDLLGWAVKYGVAICERDAYWTSLVARWAEQLALPSAAAAREREAKARTQARNLLMHRDTDAALELVVSMLTHRARATLTEAGVYPASRPELPDQLRSIGEADLAQDLETALAGTWNCWDDLLREEHEAERKQAGTVHYR